MVEYININDKEYPVRIGYLVMREIKAKTGMSYSQALGKARKEEDLEIYETILYNALRMGAFAVNGKTDIPFKEEDMPMLLDLCFFDFMNLMASPSFFPKEQVEQLEEGQDEKKSKATRAKNKKT